MEFVEKDHRLEEADLTIIADKVKNACLLYTSSNDSMNKTME